jgi:hypothetical protein
MDQSGREGNERLRASLDAWSEAHPGASFAEIEQAVEERLNALRAEWVQGVVDRVAAREAEDRASVACPECGHALESEGHKGRRVTVRGEGAVWLRRQRRTCPACGAGLFPPRRATRNSGQ